MLYNEEEKAYSSYVEHQLWRIKCWNHLSFRVHILFLNTNDIDVHADRTNHTVH